MKLFTRYSRSYTLMLLAVFAVGAGFIFLILRYILIQQVDEALDAERDRHLQYVKKYQTLPATVSVSDLHVSYNEVEKPGRAAYETAKEQDEDGVQDYRRLSFTVPLKGRFYLFRVSMPLEQTQALLKAIALVTLSMFAIILFCIYALNRRLITSILQPFYQTVATVNTYNIAQRLPLKLPATNIDEFTALNQTVNAMAARSQKDYQLVRNFTAQAAHEIQTPLAVLRGKVEALMQTPEITEEQANQITGIDHSIDRLTRLFNSLLLLTKIENRQFPTDGLVQLEMVAQEKLEEIKELLEARKITLTSALAPVQIKCNQYLAEVLIGNLLNNAVRYNYPNGSIILSLQREKFSISNTSYLKGMEEENLFQPFYRNPDNRQTGHGLGLSIIKQICLECGFTIKYHFQPDIHTFEIFF